ncbi:hypothetical protein D3C80_2136250 [compost metagenome]
MCLMQLTAIQAEAEFAWDVPERLAMPLVSLRINAHAIGHGFFVVLLDLDLVAT